MRLAVILNGTVNTTTPQCISSFEQNILPQLKTVFEVDLFSVSDKELSISTVKNSTIDTTTPKRTLLIKCVELAQSLSGYTHILLCSFNIFFYLPLHVDRLELNRFNFSYVTTKEGRTDDCFWLFPANFEPRVSRHRQFLPSQNLSGLSFLNAYLQSDWNLNEMNYQLEDPNYISRPTGEEYHYADFWIPDTSLSDFEQNKLKLYDWPIKKQKLAIILRGIMYYDGVERVCYSNRPVDYRECLPSMRANLIEPLSATFDQIDFFIITYHNDKMAEIMKDFNPRDSIIYPRTHIMKYRKVITVKLIDDAINLIEPYQKEYDRFLITRSDLYYYNGPIDLNKIDFEKFNFGWAGERGQCDDSFWLFHAGHIPAIKSYIEKEKHTGSNNCHSMNMTLPASECHYISRPLNEALKRHMPDFWFFGRYLPTYNKEKNILDSPDWNGGCLLYD